MNDNQSIAARAMEIAEELRRALPTNTDFGPGWQQRYLDRQNERYEKALEMARAEVVQELPPGELTEDEWRAAAAEDKAARGAVASRAPDIRGVDEQDVPLGVTGRDDQTFRGHTHTHTYGLGHWGILQSSPRHHHPPATPVAICNK